MFIEGCISPDNPEWDAAFKMVGAGNSVAMGNGLSLVIQQMSDRSYRVYMGVETSLEFTQPGQEADVNDMPKARETINKLFSNWAPHLRGFVAGAEGPWRPWPLYRMDQEIYLPDALRNDGKVDEKSWTRTPGVVLLGDAAHVTTPNGEGVNDAMNDAKVLFEHITAELANDASRVYDVETDSAALERAIVAYEGQMRPRAHEMIQDSINFEDMMYKEDGPQRMGALFSAMEEQTEASFKP